jgi:ribosome-associated protein
VRPLSTIPDAELTWRFTGSGGPGGQHANTANTAVEVSVDCDQLAAILELSPAEHQRLRDTIGDAVRTRASASRSQLQNRDRARLQLLAKIERALEVPEPRRATRPSRGAREARLDEKRQLSAKKRERRTVNRADDG